MSLLYKAWNHLYHWQQHNFNPEFLPMDSLSWWYDVHIVTCSSPVTGPSPGSFQSGCYATLSVLLDLYHSIADYPVLVPHCHFAIHIDCQKSHFKVKSSLISSLLQPQRDHPVWTRRSDTDRRLSQSFVDYVLLCIFQGLSGWNKARPPTWFCPSC